MENPVASLILHTIGIHKLSLGHIQISFACIIVELEKMQTPNNMWHLDMIVV